MKKDKFDQLLHKKLSSYEQTPPDDLWAAIEASTTARTSVISRYAISALVGAGIAAIICIAFLLPRANSVSPRMQESLLSEADVKETQSDETVGELANATCQTVAATSVKHKHTTRNGTETMHSYKYNMEQHEENCTPVVVAEHTSEDLATEANAEDFPLTKQQLPDIPNISAYSAKHNSAIKILAYASMANSNMSNSRMGLPNRMLSADYVNTGDFMENSIIPQIKTEEHHFIPFTFGADIRIPLTQSLSIQTGIDYSLLSSTFTYTDSGMEVHQKAHFVGVPINLAYDIAHVKAFDIYASAGGSIHKCVSATDDIDSSLDHPVHFALNCSAGVEYNFTPHISVYLQPELRYNISNSTTLHTAYTSQPFNFTLKVGMAYKFHN